MGIILSESFAEIRQIVNGGEMKAFIWTKTSLFIGIHFSFTLLYILQPDRILKFPVPDVGFKWLIYKLSSFTWRA